MGGSASGNEKIRLPEGSGRRIPGDRSNRPRPPREGPRPSLELADFFAFRGRGRGAQTEQGAAAAESTLELLALLRRIARVGRLLAFFAVLVAAPTGLLAREADLALAAIDAEDLHLDLV